MAATELEQATSDAWFCIHELRSHINTCVECRGAELTGSPGYRCDKGRELATQLRLALDRVCFATKRTCSTPGCLLQEGHVPPCQSDLVIRRGPRNGDSVTVQIDRNRFQLMSFAEAAERFAKLMQYLEAFDERAEKEFGFRKSETAGAVRAIVADAERIAKGEPPVCE